MHLLSETDFHWHSEQPDVPQKSAAEMKAFFDAPVRILFAKINELIEAQNVDGGALQEATQKIKEIIGSGYKGDPINNPEHKDLLVSLSDLAVRIDNLRGTAQYEGEFIYDLYGLSREIDALQKRITASADGQENEKIPTVGAVVDYVSQKLGEIPDVSEVAM